MDCWERTVDGRRRTVSGDRPRCSAILPTRAGLRSKAETSTAQFEFDSLWDQPKPERKRIGWRKTPRGKPNQLEALERSRNEVQLRVCEFARRVSLVVRYDLDCHGFAPLKICRA